MEDTAVQAGENLRYLLVALGVIGGGALALWLQRDKKAAKQPKKKQFVPKNTKGFQWFTVQKKTPCAGGLGGRPICEAGVFYLALTGWRELPSVVVLSSAHL